MKLTFNFRIVLVTVVFVVFFGYTQRAQHEIDSLQNVLLTLQDDTAKVGVFNKIALYYLKNSLFEKSEAYAWKANDLSGKLGYLKGKGIAFDYLGESLYQQGKHSEALPLFFTSLEAMNQAKDAFGIAYAFRQLGWTYDELGNKDEALNYWQKSYEAFKMLKHAEYTALACTRLIYIYEQSEEYAKARTLGIETINYLEKIDGKKYLAEICLTLASMQFGRTESKGEFLFKALEIYEMEGASKSLAFTYQLLGANFNENDPRSVEYYKKAFVVRETLRDTAGIAQSMNSLGSVSLRQGNYREALNYFNKANDIYNSLGEKAPLWGRPWCLANFAEVKCAMADSLQSVDMKADASLLYKEAFSNYEESLGLYEMALGREAISPIFNAMGKIRMKMGEYDLAYKLFIEGANCAAQYHTYSDCSYAYNHLSEIDSIRKDFKNAYFHHLKYSIYEDSAETVVSKDKFNELSLEYEFDKERALSEAAQLNNERLAAEELEKQKRVRNTFIGGFGIVFIFLVIVFRQRNKVNKARKRSDELLLNILPAETAEELKKNGVAKSKHFTNVTVLFTDFKNFTRVSEEMSAEALVEEINFCYSEFDRIMMKYGIEKIKTIGDSYMCAGGIPKEKSSNPEDTVMAAIAIRDFMRVERERRNAEGQPYFELRIGLHTGPVIAGIVGIKKFAYDIWGDTVNIASRMESSGEAGKINISGSTYELVKEHFKCEYRGKVVAKNKGEIDMYFVEGIL